LLAFNGDIRPTSALALVLGGSMLAVLSWSRLRVALVRADAPESARASAGYGAGDRGRRPGPALRPAAAAGAE
jgi:hypothetical protein